MKINPTARQLRVLAGGRAEGAVKPTFPAESPLRTIGLRTLEWSQYRAGAIQSGPAPVQRFTLAPLFPLGTLSVLFGPGGVGKSLVALDLCLAVARQALKHGMGNLDHAHAAGPLGATVPREAAGASVFLTLEDETGMLNVVITPQRFEKLALLISRTPLLLVRGVLEIEQRVVNLKAEEFVALGSGAGAEHARSHDYY